MNKKNKLVLLSLLLVFFVGLYCVNVQAATTATTKIDYKGQPSLDTDLDGLTDQGELQIYHTDPNKADTDGDGFGDGVEVIAGSNPLDAKSIPGSATVAPTAGGNLVENFTSQAKEIPYPWYISRASGLVAFLLLYLSILLGLALRTPVLKSLIPAKYSMKIHCWISIQAIFFALIHGIALVGDKYLKFNLIEIFMPFVSHYEPTLITLGIFGLYLMIILVATSYGRNLISQKIWRLVHLMNIVLYGVVFVHALYLGTDLKVAAFRSFFIWANAVLVFLMLVNLEIRMRNSLARKNNAA